jgi:hypothetical protein
MRATRRKGTGSASVIAKAVRACSASAIAGVLLTPPDCVRCRDGRPE